MKRREQALLLLHKAAQDEALLDQVLTSDQVSDEIIGFHCQQAAEKILKALLSDLGVRFRKTHEIGALMALAAQAGHALLHVLYCASCALGWKRSSGNVPPNSIPPARGTALTA
ncbi:MAG: HEPN domain-containing protein [Bryobacteraceae bacterium]|jgi:HEPN domain-containing protein